MSDEKQQTPDEWIRAARASGSAGRRIHQFTTTAFVSKSAPVDDAIRALSGRTVTSDDKKDGDA